MTKTLPVIQPDQRSAGQPPIFAKIGIVGLGLIGGSIALRARELWPSSLVIAVDQKDVLETAMRLHAIDVAITAPTNAKRHMRRSSRRSRFTARSQRRRQTSGPHKNQ